VTAARLPRPPGFALVYIPFGLLLVAAVLAAEPAGQPTLRRAAFTMWLTVATAAPALVLAAVYDLRRAPAAAFGWWRRLWTFAFVAFAIHLWFGHAFFEWSLAEVLDHQGWKVAGSNYLLAILWTVEMVLVWRLDRRPDPRPSTPLYLYQCGVHALMAGLVFVSADLLHTGTVRLLGILLTAAVAGGLFLRLMFGPIREPSPESPEMKLLDRVAAMWRRLGPAGWQDLLAAHGLNIPPASSPADLAALLARPVPVDRTVPGFGEFAPDGVRGIEPGRPARSLLYFALASPTVRTRRDGQTPLAAFPTPAELEAVENYVYAARRWSLDDIRAHAARVAGTANPALAVVVYAAEFRTAAGTAHRRYADLCFSRTGVARTGNAAPLYDAAERGFLYRQDSDGHAAIHVAPVRYSAWIAVRLPGSPDRFLPMDHNAMVDTARKFKAFLPDLRYRKMFPPDLGDDASRSFWVPVHKLFDGDECLRDGGRPLPLTVGLTAHLRNDKLARLFEFLDAKSDPARLNRPPFTETTGLAELSRDTRTHGAGLLVPVTHKHLVEQAMDGGKTLTIQVPPDTIPRQLAALKTPQITGPRVEYRTVPGYAHIRHELKDGTFTNLNERFPNPIELVGYLTAGNYQAVAHRDFTADGWVAASVPELTVAVPARRAAYALVAPPDFFPRIDQRRLGDVVDDDLMRAWYVPPLALSDIRVPVNLRLTEAGFDEADTTMTAIVGPADGPPPGAPATTDLPLDSPRHTALPDDAAGIFHPGWDIGLTFDQGREFLVNGTLGSPFPEDVKLCAAISSYWPGTVPDAARVFPPIAPNPKSPIGALRVLPLLPTVIPMTDREIGMERDSIAWDGSPPPRLTTVQTPTGERPAVEYVSPLHADYVSQALGPGFSLAETSRLDFAGYEARVLAMRRVYQELGVQLGPPPADETTEDPRANWLVHSFRRATDEECKKAAVKSDGTAFVVEIFKHDAVFPAPDPTDPTRRPMRFRVTFENDRMYKFLASASRVIPMEPAAGPAATLTGIRVS
jgi:hypothetical protein